MSKNVGKFIIHPLFVLFACVMIYFGDSLIFFSYFLAIIIHELSHSLIAKRLGYKLKTLCIMPYGAQLSLEHKALRCKDEIFIALAGPCSNLLCAGFFVALWWMYPLSYAYTEYFVLANVITAIFNLLPLVPLDGSRVLLAFLGIKNKRKQGYKILSVLNCIFSALLFALFIVTCFDEVNFTFGLCAIFLLMGAFEKNEEYDYCYLFQIEKNELSKKKALPIKFFAVNTAFQSKDLLKLISPDFYAIVFVLDDNFIPVRTIFESDFEKILVGDKC